MQICQKVAGKIVPVEGENPVIYLPFHSTESKGLTGLIFNKSQDKTKSPLHIFE